MSWWAIDVELFKDGKKVDMKIWKNDSPTYTDEKEVIKINERNKLISVMVNAWFTVNPWEYWHFSYWDQMWAYVNEKTTWVKTKAIYGKVE